MIAAAIRSRTPANPIQGQPMSSTQTIDENLGTTAVRAGYAFDEVSLLHWMSEHVEGFSGPLHVEQFKGGQSNK